MQPLKNTGRILIDANVLLRFLLNDNEKQANEAKEAISGGSCVLLPEVLAKVVYVLSKAYGIGRDDISASIKKVLPRMHIDNYPRNKKVRIGKIDPKIGNTIYTPEYLERMEVAWYSCCRRGQLRH